MRVMVVGSGGREHALAWRLAQDTEVEQIWVAPGNAGSCGHNITALPARDIAQWVAAAQEHQIDLTVVGPEAPLADGIADAFASANLTLLGPQARWAQLEASKSYAKEVMKQLGIPTAAYTATDNLAETESWLRAHQPPYVLKADGLAGGKGVEIKHSIDDAKQAAAEMLAGKYGSSSRRIVLEQFLVGEEFSFIALCAGRSAVALPVCTDYKRLADCDQGPNTGGMGCCCPAQADTSHKLDSARLLALFIQPMLDMMADAGQPYRGFIYVGLIVAAEGTVQALEYNVRLGDPEAQVLLPLWCGSLASCLLAAARGSIEAGAQQWHKLASIGIVLAAPGYPGSPVLDIALPSPAAQDNSMLFHQATKRDSTGRLLNSGGRVFCATSWHQDFTTARGLAYQLASKASFADAHFRKDIAAVQQEKPELSMTQAL